MRILLPLTVVTCCAIMSISHAAPIPPANYPTDLKYKGNFIDPTCFTDGAFEQDNYRQGNIELNKCSSKAPKLDMKLVGNYAYYPAHNFIGYPAPEDPQYGFNGFYYYRTFKAAPGYYFAESIFSGGGTGVFTTLRLITRIDSNTFKSKGIAGGDRCNGGISVDEHSSNNNLRYRENMTPADFISFSTVNKKTEKLFEQLDHCAVCCVAQSVHEVNDAGNDNFLYVDLKKYGQDYVKQEANTEPEKDTQSCFNEVLSSYLKSGKIQLNAKELKVFVNDFIKSCTT